MKLYLNNLIPRLKEYSATLDKIELFVDVPWVIVDEDQNQQKYIFKRNGDLIMSLNGQVSIGKWELLSAARSLLIDRIQNKILLNQNFIDSAVMILKKDGFKDENLILANEILIPDLNVTGYLKQLYYQKNKITLKQLKNGITLEVAHINLDYKKVTIEGDPVSDGKYELEGSDKLYLVQNSQLKRTLIRRSYDTKKGRIIIEQTDDTLSNCPLPPSIGDMVFQNNDPAPDGKYKTSFMEYIKVENGKIIDMSMF